MSEDNKKQDKRQILPFKLEAEHKVAALGLLVIAGIGAADHAGLFNPRTGVAQAVLGEGYSRTTILAQAVGSDAIAMMNCANRVADRNAPLIPADLEVWAAYQITQPGEAIYDSRDEVNPAQEALRMQWEGLLAQRDAIINSYPDRWDRDNWTQADRDLMDNINERVTGGVIEPAQAAVERSAIFERYPSQYDRTTWSEADTARIDALDAQAAALYEGVLINGLSVQVVRNERFSATGERLADELSLVAYTNEGATAPRTYGDAQFWVAQRLSLDGRANVVDVTQLDQSIGDRYDRDAGTSDRVVGMRSVLRTDPQTQRRYRDYENVLEAPETRLTTVQRDQVAQCFAEPLATARSVLGS